MAIEVLDSDTVSLLHALSHLSSNQLAIAVTQHADLSDHIADVLHRLAASSLAQPPFIKIGADEGANTIANLARKLMQRGDPSLVRKLLPKQSSLLDLAICTHAEDILTRLMDESSALDGISAAFMAFQRTKVVSIASQEDHLERLGRAARVLASVASSVSTRIISDAKLTTGQREHNRKVTDLMCKILDDIRVTYDGIVIASATPSGRDDSALYTKVSLLDAAWFITERHSMSVVRGTRQSILTECDDILEALCGTSISSAGTQALIDLPLAMDLALKRPLLLLLKTVVTDGRVKLFDSLAERVERIQRSAKADGSTNATDAGWVRVISSAREHWTKPSQVDPGLVETVLAVLPHLGEDRAALERQLRHPKLAGKSVEMIVQLLLEDGDVDTFEDANHIAEPDSEMMRLLQERTSLFDDQELARAKVIWGKAREAQDDRFDLSAGLSEEVRAAILARAEASNEEEEEEWNPFDEGVREVGFEEELGEEVEEANRAGEHDSEEEDDEIEEGEADGKRGAAGHGSEIAGSTGAAAERAAERILISTWSEKGQAVFGKDARKSSGRVELKAKLNDLPGRVWDDGLIESWATMFARNPRKDKLLASVDDIMRLGNRNIDTSRPSSDFGPDRGRGGRIKTGQQQGAGRGDGTRGRGRGRGGNRGQNRGRGRGGARGG